MKREIKFRAWNILTKTMIDLKKITPLALNMDTDGLFLPFSDGLPLMQYTGLKDKNGSGKEVYEKDFFETSKGFGVVEWLEGGWIVKFNTYEIPLTQFLRNDIEREVKGNVYENKGQ